jgi:hypothetical protein
MHHVALLAVALLAAEALAQLQGKTALVYERIGTGTIRGAASTLGMTVHNTSVAQTFYDKLSGGTWDLVGIDWPTEPGVDKEQFADVIEAYIASGGRVICNLTNLDEYPKLQQVLGVAGTVELLEPTWVFGRPPGNPIWPATTILEPNGFTTWPDSGDELTPAAGAYAAAFFDSAAGPPAVIVSNDLRVLTNGFDWESYMTSSNVAKTEIQFLFRCHADANGDSVLDLFDFLWFINDWDI